jgi:hypothetical protein
MKDRQKILKDKDQDYQMDSRIWRTDRRSCRTSIRTLRHVVESGGQAEYPAG